MRLPIALIAILTLSNCSHNVVNDSNGVYRYSCVTGTQRAENIALSAVGGAASLAAGYWMLDKAKIGIDGIQLADDLGVIEKILTWLFKASGWMVIGGSGVAGGVAGGSYGAVGIYKWSAYYSCPKGDIKLKK